MGAAPFKVLAWGKDAGSAFARAVSEARYQSGHGGYTGTIAEKHSFKVVTPPTGVAALDFIHWVRIAENEESSPKIPDQYRADAVRVSRFSDDKHAPAIAVELVGDELVAVKAKNPRIQIPDYQRAFVFFGWAAE